MPVMQREKNITAAKPKLWTLDFVLICLSSLTVCLAFHSLIPTLPMYIQEHGGSKSMAGLAMAALTVAAVIIRPVSGWALDRYGRRVILIAGLLTFLLPSLVYTLMLPIIPLLFFRFLQGFGWGIGTTSQGTVASDIIPGSRLGEGLGFFSLAVSISLATAPAIGLWLVNRFSFHALFLAGALLTTISMALGLLIKYPARKAPEQAAKPVIIEKQALGPSLVMLLTTTTYSSLLSFLALFVQQKGMTTAGLFFTVVAVTTFISRPLAGTIVDRKGRGGYDLTVFAGLFAIIAAMIIIARTSSPGHLIAGGLLFGIGFGSVQPSMLALCINSVPLHRRGAANATYWTAFDTGVAFGSVFWGVLANYSGYAVMYYLNIIPPLLALPVYLWNKKSKLKPGAD
ncbi:major facilitator family transporter [Desulfocucumis palustris]|uniref:Major facilitator family transporter n=1 Tax=Desulfocucumis palustris TaxID=1898651 RepID=A0A2L2XMD4_9FIRM|nr:MFS transporter [Desulfocucumis palustris]GBF35111.1 major facilitator family transporter [Desulfocucumis palustris]